MTTQFSYHIPAVRMAVLKIAHTRAARLVSQREFVCIILLFYITTQFTAMHDTPSDLPSTHCNTEQGHYCCSPTTPKISQLPPTGYMHAR